MVGVSRRALSARRVSTISWGQSHRWPARELLRTIQRVEKVGVELIATKKRARNAQEAVCLVADPGRQRAAAEVFRHAAYFEALGSISQAGLSSLQQRQRAPGEEVGGVTVGVLVSNTVESHARVC